MFWDPISNRYWPDEASKEPAPPPPVERPARGWNVSALEKLSLADLRNLQDTHDQARARRIGLEGQTRGALLPLDGELSDAEERALIAVALSKNVEQAEADHDAAVKLASDWRALDKAWADVRREAIDDRVQEAAEAFASEYQALAPTDTATASDVDHSSIDEWLRRP